MQRTAFVKKKSKTFVVPGTHSSLHNGLLLVSTGIPSLDDILGGGLPVGTVLLIEEDFYSRFSNVIVKYFLAEGVLNEHGLFTVSTNKNPKHLIEDLPKPVSSASKKQKNNGDINNMQIAFMYKNLPQHSTTLSDESKYGHYYDISSNMNVDLIEKCRVETLQLSPDQSDNFKYTLSNLKNHISENPQYLPPVSLESHKSVNVLRMAIPNLAGPLWCENNKEATKNIAKFLHGLRALARKTMLVGMVTIPTHLYNESQIAVFRHLVDGSVKLNAFMNEKNPAFKQYHGMFVIKKLPCVNSLTFSIPKSFDLAFELKKTKFDIVCFHLPPDLSETVSRQGVDEPQKNTSLCGGTSLSKRLDF